MTLAEFHSLRRGDVILWKGGDATKATNLYRCTRKAKYDPDASSMCIPVTDVVCPNVRQDFCESNIKEFNLTPFLKNKYGFTT